MLFKQSGSFVTMSESKRYIVDATVGAKWYLKDEPLQDKAWAFLAANVAGHFSFSAPAIFLHEVAGALKRASATRSKSATHMRISSQQAIASIKQLYSLQIQLHPSDVIEAVEAFDMAVRFSKGHYDMLYLRLAQKLGCQLVTADTRMIEAVPNDFPRGSICLLSDWVF